MKGGGNGGEAKMRESNVTRGSLQFTQPSTPLSSHRSRRGAPYYWIEMIVQEDVMSHSPRQSKVLTAHALHEVEPQFQLVRHFYIYIYFPPSPRIFFNYFPDTPSMCVAGNSDTVTALDVCLSRPSARVSRKKPSERSSERQTSEV